MDAQRVGVAEGTPPDRKWRHCSACWSEVRQLLVPITTIRRITKNNRIIPPAMAATNRHQERRGLNIFELTTMKFGLL